MRKRVWATVLAVAMVLSLMMVPVSAEETASGTCGDNLTWVLDEDGTLTISGTGDMTDWSGSSKVPWYDYCSSIVAVIIEDGVTGIGSYAFSGCSSLTSIEIPASMTNIGDHAFYNCIGLVSVVIPDGVTSIDQAVFYHCASLTSVTIPDSVISIGDYAFENCTSLTSIEIPDSVTSIGINAFCKCSCLLEISIPDGVISIGKYAFYQCTKLTSVTIGDSVTSIGSDAFMNTGYYNDESNWEDGVLYLEHYLLNTNEEFSSETYSVKEGTTVIATGAFYGCTGLASVTIPYSMIGIGSSAFNSCTSLTSIEIPGSVTTIGSYAFSGCSSLTSITIPDSVTSLGSYAFYTCSSLTNVTIGNGVTNINSYTFQSCSGLTNVTIGNSVTSLGSYAFSGCSSLTGITIPDNLASIGDYAFYYCTGLTSVTIPSSVTSIGKQAFRSCTGLSTIWFEGDAPTFAANTYDLVGGDYGYTVAYGVFKDVTATAYYPAGNSTWTEDVMQDYAGTITWVSYGDPCTDGHTEGEAVIENEVAATCTENGSYDEVVYCSVCGEELSRETVSVPATDHTEGEAVIENEVAATETEDGSYDIVIYCTVCGAELSRETVIVPATGSTDPEPTEPTDPEPTEPTDPEPTEPTEPTDPEPTDPTEENPFTDVDETNYFYDAVLWAIENGITSGTSETTFSPYQEAERCQVVTFLWRAAGCPEVAEGTENPFTDVSEDNYFYTAVLWAVEQGITTGTSDTTFSPYATCERCQVVTFLYRYSGEPEVTSNENPFTDVSEENYFYNAVLWAVENGITSGTTETTFGPFVTCERCMVVTFLYRALVE